ncbi:hypothetical protein L218DRAFT_957777 [Marasmius fiardii PR-910]|nr:hypothetical protein L218DRAFT_957777 [Marasmius fiardii PR-910]
MYSSPAAANYYSPPAQQQKQRGYRICDQCGLVETPTTRFRLCGGCMITQYCSQECQKIHWPGHKPICKHTKAQQEKASVTYAMSPDENIVKNLRRFTSAHTGLLGWAGFQALQLKRMPSNIRQSALLIELAPRSHPQSHCRFSIASTHIVNPRKYIRDPLVVNDIREREERCRRNGGIGTLVIIIQCNDISQVMPVEVDPPSKITWDTREDWLQVLHHFVDSGRTDFQPISTTPRGVYYG